MQHHTISKDRLPLGTLLELQRWNTPSVYNGWEQMTSHDASIDAFNLEETRDFMPELGPMVGYAVTVSIEPSKIAHRQANPDAWEHYRQYVANQPGPKIVIVEDMDKPNVIGSFWGEVNASIHRSLGCVGTITDGAIRDLQEMKHCGFKALSRRLCVGHAHAWPVAWGRPVQVFGRCVEPGQLIHADQHGFLAIPKEDEQGLLEATSLMDRNECETVIAAARSPDIKGLDDQLNRINEAAKAFGQRVVSRTKRSSEWR
jgi:regulator of RNase E activity RraA